MVGEDFRSQVDPVVKTLCTTLTLGEHGPGCLQALPRHCGAPPYGKGAQGHPEDGPTHREDGPFPVCGYVARVVCPW